MVRCTRIMCERGLRARGAEDDADLARPESPSRCTLPITALRVMPPSSPATWLAESPSAQSFLSSSTRSSVQDMSRFPFGSARCRWQNPPSQSGEGRAGITHALKTQGNCSLRHLVLNGHEATIWRDSGARVGATQVRIFLLLNPVNPQKAHPPLLSRHSG